MTGNQIQYRKRLIADILLILIGSVIQAISLNLFLIPANLVGGGVSGLSQIINHFTGWPIGLMIILGNIPLFFLGWRYLGGVRFATRTIFAVLSYSIAVETIRVLFQPTGITDDLLLNALYGAIVSGFGLALVYRGQGTSGGTDILAKILSHKKSLPLSQTYLFTDTFTMLMAGLTFNWDRALYAIMMLYVSGITAESFSQGSRMARTAMIVTDKAEIVGKKIIEGLNRGVTELPAKGLYTGNAKSVLYVVVGRSEVERLKALVSEGDPGAFMVIGQANEALGEGFQSINKDA